MTAPGKAADTAYPTTQIFDASCDAEQISGLLIASEGLIEGLDIAHQFEGGSYRLLSGSDAQALAAVVRSARQLAEKLTADLQELH